MRCFWSKHRCLSLLLTCLCLSQAVASHSLSELGRLSDEDVQEEGFCRKHELSDREKDVRIYDAFTFNTELDMLELRLTELYDMVDYFVIAESCRTLQDKPKALHYKENAVRFARFADKIIHLPLGTDPEEKAEYRMWQQRMVKDKKELLEHKALRYGPLDEPFYREWYQREQIFREGLNIAEKEARLGDLIMLSDVDEIPRPHAVRALRKCDFAAAGHNCAALEGVFFYYSYSQKAGEWKAAPKVIPYDGAATMGGMDQESIRYDGNCSLQLPETSTHCSYCFGTFAALKNKLSSFMHWQLDKEPFTNPAFILDRVTRGIYLFGPDEERGKLTEVPYCDYAPKAALDNPMRFHYMLARDPQTGSFADFDEYFDRSKVKNGRIKLKVKPRIDNSLNEKHN